MRERREALHCTCSTDRTISGKQKKMFILCPGSLIDPATISILIRLPLSIISLEGNNPIKWLLAMFNLYYLYSRNGFLAAAKNINSFFKNCFLEISKSLPKLN